MAETPISDEERFAQLGNDLADGVLSELGGWMQRCCSRFGLALSTADVLSANTEVESLVAAPLRALISADIDLQRGTPLTIIRRAVAVPTELLRSYGVEPIGRDPFDAQQFPHDIYGLSPASFADIHESLHEPGLRWSVAKAYLHRQRHQHKQDQTATNPPAE